MKEFIILINEELNIFYFDSSFLDEYEKAFLTNLDLEDINE